MTRPVRFLTAWGMHVRSVVDLPGAMPTPATNHVDLDIVFGAPPLADAMRCEGPYRLGRDAFEFVMPGVARYLCEKGRIGIDPEPRADDRDIAAMLIATVIPALLWAEGEIVLHAAAAVLPGTSHAIAVLGRSGAGKSTLLARVVAQGARIVADDSIRVHRVAGSTRISGLGGGYFAPLAAGGKERRFFPVRSDRQCADAPLGAILILDPSLGSRRLTGADAIAALLAHRHRPRILRLLGREGDTFIAMADLCRDIPIHADASASRIAVDARPIVA